MRQLVPALLLVVTTACGSLPPCEEVELTNLAVDTTAPAPVISWEGAAAALTVSATANDALVWEVRCNCMDEEADPDSNASCAETEEEFEYRHCLEEPVSYGALPQIETIATSDEFDNTKSEADALVPGEEYEARAQAYCDGGDGPDAVHSIEQLVTFLAP